MKRQIQNPTAFLVNTGSISNPAFPEKLRRPIDECHLGPHFPINHIFILIQGSNVQSTVSPFHPCSPDGFDGCQTTKVHPTCVVSTPGQIKINKPTPLIINRPPNNVLHCETTYLVVDSFMEKVTHS